MLKNKLFVALAITACSGFAIADDKIDYSFSLKNWNNKISQGNSTNTVNGTVISATAKKETFLSLEAGYCLSHIPTVKEVLSVGKTVILHWVGVLALTYPCLVAKK